MMGRLPDQYSPFAAADQPSPENWADLTRFYAGSHLLQSSPSFAAVATACRGDLVYLATPYSRLVTDPEGRLDFELSAAVADDAAIWAACFAARGVTALSPIAMAHAMLMADPHDLLDPLSASFWTGWCRPLLAACDVVVVPDLPGWDGSSGIWQEVRAHLDRQARVYLAVRPGGDPELWGCI